MSFLNISKNIMNQEYDLELKQQFPKHMQLTL